MRIASRMPQCGDRDGAGDREREERVGGVDRPRLGRGPRAVVAEHEHLDPPLGLEHQVAPDEEHDRDAERGVQRMQALAAGEQIVEEERDEDRQRRDRRQDVVVELGLDDAEQRHRGDGPQGHHEPHAALARRRARPEQPRGERGRQQRGPQPHAVADLRNVVLERPRRVVDAGRRAVEHVGEHVLVDPREACLGPDREVPGQEHDERERDAALELEQPTQQLLPAPEHEHVEHADDPDDREPGGPLREHADAEQRVAAEHVDLAHPRERRHREDLVGRAIGRRPAARERQREHADQQAIGRAPIPAREPRPPRRRIGTQAPGKRRAEQEHRHAEHEE
ncbi:MAG: hypothetical protein NT062_29760, partial [Proteobacteria bacterium]|nr:hypothetical protein [Pseudomonadota bacterium]